jgi:glycolate oxidase FAD binding subunit
VADVVRYANTHGLALIPLGGRQPRGLGNAPARYDVALDTTALDAVVDYEPEDLTITCQAGITLGALRAATGASGQMVPFDPAIPDEATVGGVLAADVWGPSRLSLGASRDFTIGLRVVTGDGLTSRAGGRVVKNVAGYDMCKLYIGSLGTLAVITEATFKTLPLPHATRELSFAFATSADACAIANQALTRGLSLRSAVVTRATEGWALHLTLAASEAAVERSAAEITALADVAGGEATSPVIAAARSVAVRLATLPSRLPEILSELPASTSVSAYPTLGVARVGLDDLVSLEVPSGAKIVVESCPPGIKSGIDVFGRPPQSLALMRGLKARLDPDGVLSPGRFVGRL